MHRMKLKEQVLAGIYTKTKKLRFSKRHQTWLLLALEMSVTFTFIFKVFSHKIWSDLNRKHCFMHSITKIVIKHFLSTSASKHPCLKILFSRQSITKILRPITLPSHFNVGWSCDCIWVDSSCHSGGLYLRYNIKLGIGTIRIGICCTLSNVLKILTGFDKFSIYFVTDCRYQILV